MEHDRVPEVYVHFALMYMTDHIFPVLPISDLINEYGNPTTPPKMATGKNLQYHIYACYFFHVLYGKLRRTLRTKEFHGIFVVIPEHQQGYLVYVPSTRKIISSYDVVFDESFSNALAYTSGPHSEEMEMRPAVMYT